MHENELNELIYKAVGAVMNVHSEIGYGLRKTTGLIINFKHPSLEWRKVTLNS